MHKGVHVARDRVLRPREVAAVTGLSVGTLERLRRLGIGPVFVRIGPRALGYLESDLVAYLDARRARETPPKPPTTA